MSSEVLENAITPYFYREDEPQFTHDAVHDLESFLWVVVYLCITRKGPGGARRDELGPGYDAKKDPAVKDLWGALFDLFEGDATTLGKTKGDLLKQPELFSQRVVPHLHTNFKLLAPMAEEWWKVLRVAYLFRAYEYEHIHRRVLDILDRTIEMVKNTPQAPDPTIIKAAQEEDSRRRNDYHRFLNAFREPPARQASPGAAAHWNTGVSPAPQIANQAAPSKDPGPSPSPSPAHKKRRT